MSASLVANPPIKIPRGQDTTIRVKTFPATDISSWGAVLLTIRADPNYPRASLVDVTAARTGDLDTKSWSVALTSTAYTVVDAAKGIFDIAIPRAAALALEAGTQRYVLDVWRTDPGSEWQVVEPTWVSMLPSIRDN
ncbi:hypothetical protein VT84_30720 [Gemmata sp. SH-PL17]|uniref:hypothetical protein n=1 Tax=Gemmata sp. SH-PL17 TaxID=1630693 RepID=UPI00078C4D28|nr:hypothetical protein [Gemmata sp. SH-PL17]AMV28807.1 hypothetical protein VT84_30720 [Gemmata sp. SH-PL17]